jgi:DNA (cytosine-5)-methyltransferase 1
MSTGFHRDGRFRIVGAVDRQLAKPSQYGKATTSCNETYALNMGIAPLDADIAQLDPHGWRTEMLDMERGELDVLISCAPCTGFSQKNAGNHARDDRRNSLVVRSADFVEELLPKTFVMENVKELLRGRNLHHFTALRDRLEALGYRVSAGVHELADLGLPQLRRRALVIAHRDGDAPPLPPPEGATRRTVRDAIGHLPPLRAGEERPDDPMHVCGSPTGRSMERIRATPRDGGSWADLLGTPDEHLLIPSMLRPDRRRGSFPDVYGRLWWDQPARTITRECGHAGNGRYLHPEQDRHLSVREMALLQGFPPDYRFAGRLSSKYNQVGDAVPPLISTMVAAHLARILDGTVEDAAGQLELAA